MRDIPESKIRIRIKMISQLRKLFTRWRLPPVYRLTALRLSSRARLDPGQRCKAPRSGHAARVARRAGANPARQGCGGIGGPVG